MFSNRSCPRFRNQTPRTPTSAFPVVPSVAFLPGQGVFFPDFSMRVLLANGSDGGGCRKHGGGAVFRHDTKEGPRVWSPHRLPLKKQQHVISEKYCNTKAGLHEMELTAHWANSEHMLVKLLHFSTAEIHKVLATNNEYSSAAVSKLPLKQMGLRIHGLPKKQQKKPSCTIAGLFAWKKRQTKATSSDVHPAVLRCFEGLLLRGKDYSGRMRMDSRGKFWLSFLDVKNSLFLVLKRQKIGTIKRENRRTVRSTARSSERGAKHRFREDIYSLALQASTSESKSGW